MSKLLLLMLALALLFVGCGANKDYVDEQIAASEARLNNKVTNAQQTSEANQAEIEKLKGLASELSSKTDMAINKAAGFENYQVLWTGEINFDFDSYAITDIAGGILSEAGAKLEGTPGSIVEIVGHTDRTGSATYNYLLGERRAASTKRYLAEKFGISLYRMFVMSYGKDKPVAMPDERNSSSKNRRVVVTVWGMPQ